MVVPYVIIYYVEKSAGYIKNIMKNYTIFQKRNLRIYRFFLPNLVKFTEFYTTEQFGKLKITEIFLISVNSVKFNNIS